MNLQFYSIILFCMNWIRAMGFNATIFQLYHGDQFYWWRNPDCIQYIYRIGLKGYSTIEPPPFSKATNKIYRILQLLFSD